MLYAMDSDRKQQRQSNAMLPKLAFDPSSETEPEVGKLITVSFCNSEPIKESELSSPKTYSWQPVCDLISQEQFMARNMSLIRNHKAQKLYEWLLTTLHSTGMATDRSVAAARLTPLCVVQPTNIMINEKLLAEILSFMNAHYEIFDKMGHFVDRVNQNTRELDIALFLDQLQSKNPINKSAVAAPSLAEIEQRRVLDLSSQAALDKFYQHQRVFYDAHNRDLTADMSTADQSASLLMVPVHTHSRMPKTTRMHNYPSLPRQYTDCIPPIFRKWSKYRPAQNTLLIIFLSNKIPPARSKSTVIIEEITKTNSVSSAPLQPHANNKSPRQSTQPAPSPSIISSMTKWVSSTAIALCALFKYRNDLYNGAAKYVKRVYTIVKKSQKKIRHKMARRKINLDSLPAA